VEELLTELDPNHDGQISEEEFMLILKYIQQKKSTSFPPINGQSPSGTPEKSQESIQQSTETMKMYEADKKKYGALLPKTGVYFLPDDKVIGFLQ